MPETNSNPESTWGKNSNEKAAWVAKNAPETIGNNPAQEKPPAEVDSSNPQSTWGATPEKKVEYYEANVEGFDPENPVGKPTETGANDETLFEDRPETQNTVDAGPVEYSGDDRPPEYQPIYQPAEGSNLDYTPPPEDVVHTEDQPVTNEPTPGASDPVPKGTQPPPVPSPEMQGYVDTAEPVPDYTELPSKPEVDDPEIEPVTKSADSAKGTPGVRAAKVREKASGASAALGPNDGSGVSEDIKVEKK